MSQVMFTSNWLSFLLFLSAFLVFQVQCLNSDPTELKGRNGTYTSVLHKEERTGVVEKFTKDLANIFSEARKGGGGGKGDGLAIGDTFMKTIVAMCSTTIPMVTMTVMGWMKDIMMMGAGAFMMVMYDMLRNKGDQKKIIIKLPPQSAPEPAPPAQTGYGPWEGR